MLERISEQVGIGAPTIRDTYSQVYKLRDRLLPDYLLINY